MPDQKIYVLGSEDIVLLFGLLGIEGNIIENTEDFLKIFNKIIKDPLIAMIIISINLPDDVIEFLIDFKLNNRSPFIFFLPDIFEPDIETKDKVLNKIQKSIMEIIFKS